MFVLSVGTPLSARAAASAGQPGAFLRQELGARASALGGAFGAVVDDASSIYWNPAGLASLKKPELTATHVILFEDTAFDVAAAAIPTQKWGAFGAGYLLQSSGGFERRSGPSDSPGNFSVSQTAFIGAWGKAFKAFFPTSLGFALKGVRETIDTANAGGWGADLGAQARPLARLRVGLLYQNAVAPEIRFISQSISYPRRFDGSAAYEGGSPQGFHWVAAARIASTEGQSPSASGGVEFWRERMAALRLGMQEKGISTGVGFRWGNTQVDYAILLHDLGLSHQMSLRLAFGQTPEELQEIIRRGIQKLTREEAKRLARAYRAEAEAALERNNYSKAVSDLEAAMLWDPDDLSIGRRLREVLSQVEEAVNRQIAERMALLAREQQRRGNLVASLSYWKNVLDVDPGHREAREATAAIERALGQVESEAERARRERARQQARSAMASARALAEKGRYREALQQSERAAKLVPGDPELARAARDVEGLRTRFIGAKIEEGERWMVAGQVGKALAAYDAVLSEDPQNTEVRSRISELQRTLKAPLSEEVRKQIEKKYYMAVDGYLKARYEEAQARLNEIFALDPADENARKLKEKVDAALKISPR